MGRLATLRPDGSPHIVPFCFALEGDILYSAVDRKPKTSAALTRLANVRRDPRVSVLVDEWSENWERLWWVRVDGRASLLAGGEAAGRALRLLASKYEQYRAAPPPGPVLAIAAQRWTGWSAG